MRINKLKLQLLNKFEITYNEDWLINKTNIHLPMECKWLLSLGEKFALPTTNKNLSTIHIIADIEQCIQESPEDDKDNIRTNLSKKLFNFKRNRRINGLEKFIFQTYNTTKEILKEHKDNLIVTTADKGNKTVIMYKEEYNRKMYQLLDDKNTYRQIRIDPTSKLQKMNNVIVNDLFKKEYIDKNQKFQLYDTSAIVPRLYGLPKIHKEGTPLRPIASSTNVPCYNLAKHIGQILKTLISDDLNTKNCTDTIKKLENITIEPDDILVSFDAISLFTNIPTEYAIKTIMTQWAQLESRTKIPKSIFLKILQFCLKDNNYFKFDQKLYSQTFGMPMGNPLSPTIADIVLDDLLTRTMTNLKVEGIDIKFIVKYVDDIFAIVNKNDLEKILTQLNKQHDKLQFTVEIEKDNKLPFLDICIHRQNSTIFFDWYTKPMSSGRIINYLSAQPKQTKVNTAFGLISKVLDIADPRFKNKNIHKLTKNLQQNGYPLILINSLINKKINQKNLNNTRTATNNNAEKQYFGTTFVNHLTDNKSLKLLIPNNNMVFSHKSNTTLKAIFTNTKDKIDKKQQCNVVYEIPCKGVGNNKCDKVYIGTTKRTLGVRLTEHEMDIKKKKGMTGISQHALDTEHTPDFDNTKILDIENKHKKRMTLESLRIRQKANKTINSKEDIDKISANYNLIIDSLG